MLLAEAYELGGGVRSARGGVRAARAASCPGVAALVDGPLFDDRDSVVPCVEGSRVATAAGYLPADGLLPISRRLLAVAQPALHQALHIHVIYGRIVLSMKD